MVYGPYYQWTRKLNGKTETRLLGAAQMARDHSWFENAKQLRPSLEVAKSAEDWS